MIALLFPSVSVITSARAIPPAPKTSAAAKPDLKIQRPARPNVLHIDCLPLFMLLMSALAIEQGGCHDAWPFSGDNATANARMRKPLTEVSLRDPYLRVSRGPSKGLGCLTFGGCRDKK